MTADPQTAGELQPIRFSDIEAWPADDHAAAYRAFRDSAGLIAENAPKTRRLGADGDLLRNAAQNALALGDVDADRARTFFELNFTPSRIAAKGFVTGYYEPEVAASRIRTEQFPVPLYRRPDDLIDVTDVNRPPGLDAEIRFARRTARGIEPFFDRAAIETGALRGRGLELAWLESPVDAFFIHVQGSARLRLPDGATMRVAFDGKSGHVYTSIGRLAVQRGLLALEQADKDGLEGWLRNNPERGAALMRENRSFIFFRETQQNEAAGPLGAAGVPLVAGRSLAVDRTLVTFHTPVWVDAPELAVHDRPGEHFRRLMMAQDTGSAIVGPGRGDIFIGSGDEAGSLAGRIRHRAAMILLLPHPAGR